MPENSLALANTLSYAVDEIIELPADWHGYSVVDDNGCSVPVQCEDKATVAIASVPAHSFIVLNKTDKRIEKVPLIQTVVLENELIRYEFSQSGQLIRAFDKKENKEIISEGCSGNILTLYDDRPNNWDAWDIDLFYENCAIETFSAKKIDYLPAGAVRQGIRFKGIIGKSEILQDIYLSANSKRLDFRTHVNWREKHRMLRVAFPVNIQSDYVSFDIQYGYVRRPTHRNTLWDVARFEVVAHKYADLSDNDYGVAVLNNGKYGHKIHDNVIDVNLLRSPNYPGPDADIGEHDFTYSLYPHAGDLIRSDVIEKSAQLNRPVIVFNKSKTTQKNMPWRLDRLFNPRQAYRSFCY